MLILAQTTFRRHKRHIPALAPALFLRYDICEQFYTKGESGVSRRKWWYLFEKKAFIAALIIALSVLLAVSAYIGMTHTPIASIVVSPASEPHAWTFALHDGTALAPDGEGGFVLPDTAATVYCTRSLAELEDELTASAVLTVNTRTCDVAVFADGELLADPTHRFSEADGVFAAPTGKGTNGGVFTLGTASALTLAVRFLGENTSVSALPSVEIFSSAPAYYSQWMAPTAESALPAGMFLAAAILLAGLFLLRLYDGAANRSYLLLSLLALSFGLLQTVSYSASVIWFLQSPLVIWSIQVLPTIIILWLLWYHTTGGLRRFGWLLPLLCVVGAAVGVIWRSIDLAAGAKWTNLLQGKLLPFALLFALLVCGWQAYRKNAYYRRFFLWGGVLAVCAGAATLVSCWCDGAWWRNLRTAVQNASMLGSFFQPTQLVNQLLLVLFFVLAVCGFIEGAVRRRGELQALTLQNRYASEHAAYLRRSLDETREVRHEIRHHLEALKALCGEGDISRISRYVDALGGELSELPDRYTDNALINALVASCAAEARKLGADFEAIVQVPEHIGIEDTDLAVLLSNMTDNALEAVSSVPDGESRLLRLKVEIFEDMGLYVGCSNSFAGELKHGENGELLSTKRGEGHGLGLKAMHRVAEKYNSVLVLEQEDGIFHAKTYLYYK